MSAKIKKVKLVPPVTATAPVVLPSRHAPLLAVAVLFIVTLVLYWPCLHHGFVYYDDNQYVLENSHVTTGLSLANLAWAFSTGYAYNWHPLTWLSHMLDCSLYGLRPWGHHLTNILLHALNTVLVFMFLRVLTGAFWRCLVVALLFGCHPLHVESVAWVAERKDLLSAFFGFTSLLFYTRYAKKQRPQWFALNYSLALLAFALGLMCKPMLVTWPFVLLLLDYWPLNRFLPARLWPLLWEKIPFFLLATAASLTTFLVQQQGGAVSSTAALPFPARAANAVVSYCRYLGKLVWPTNLAVLYPHPGHWPVIIVFIAVFMVIVLSAIAFKQRNRRPWLLIGWLWFLGTLVPVIGLVQVGRQAMADRYMYIPSIGIFLLIVWGVAGFTRRWQLPPVAVTAATAIATVLFAAATHQQLAYWQNCTTLFTHTIAVTENNYLAHNVLSAAYIADGHIDQAIAECREALRLRADYADACNNLGVAYRKQGRVDDAVNACQQAVQLEPGDADFRNDLGAALADQGQIDGAIESYQEALRLRPSYAMAHNNLGAALEKAGHFDAAVAESQAATRLDTDNSDFYNTLGTAQETKGHAEDAISAYQNALRLAPDNAMARANLANIFWKQGRIDEAITQYEAAVRSQTNNAKVYANFALACLAKDRIADAITNAEKAVSLDPQNPSAHYILGIALVQIGQLDSGIAQYIECLRLNPRSADAHNDLGAALAKQGRVTDAIAHYQEALCIDPGNADAHGNLGSALLSQGQHEAALKHFQEAARLQPDNPDAQTNLARALQLMNKNSSN